jgi:hypothetical protein
LDVHACDDLVVVCSLAWLEFLDNKKKGTRELVSLPHFDVELYVHACDDFVVVRSLAMVRLPW